MTASAQPKSADEANEESNTSTDGDGEWGAGSLSVDDADRFAAQFRPSWETTDPEGDWGAGPAEPPVAAAAPAPEPAATPVAAPPAEAPAPVPKPMVEEPSIVVADELTAAAAVAAATPTPRPKPKPRPVTNPSAFDAVPDPVAIPSGSNRNVLLAIGGAVVLLVIVIGAVMASGTDAPATLASAPAAESIAAEEEVGSAETTASAAAAPAAPAEAAEAVAEIAIAIRTEPADAQLTLDGRRVDNPYQVSLPPSGTHIVLVTAEGFEGRREEVRFDSDVDLTVSLEALEPEPAPAPVAVAQPRAAPVRTPRMTAPRMRTAPMRRAATMSGRMTAGFTTANPY